MSSTEDKIREIAREVSKATEPVIKEAKKAAEPIIRDVKEATRRPRGREARLPPWARPPTSWPPLLFLDVGSKSPELYSMRKSRSRRFHSVWTPFDIPFLRNTEIGNKTTIWAGPPVNRLVPKII